MNAADLPPSVALDGGYCSLETVMECPRCGEVFPIYRVPLGPSREFFCGPCGHVALLERPRREGDALRLMIYGL